MVVGLTLAVIGPLSLPPGSGSAPAAATTAHRIGLPIDPVRLGDVHWSDTWGAPRSGGRSHIGVDIMGPKMVPLLAVRDSVVTWGRFDNDRGTIVRLRDADGWEYQYIHLNNDTPGSDDGAATCEQALAAKLCATVDPVDGDLQRGVSFAEGELVGYLGDSGNAEWTAAHLHFEVYAPDVNAGGVVAMNPTPFVDRALDRHRAGGDIELGPWGSSTEAREQIFQRLYGRSPNSEEAAVVWSSMVDRGVAGALADLAETSDAAMIDRLYLAFFNRHPDGDGYDYWIDTRADGASPQDIAEWFAMSSEYRSRHGSGDFGQFLDGLYRDVLGRDPDADGKAYWLDLLATGQVNRGTIVVYFSEGTELRAKSRFRTELTILNRAFGLPRPTTADVGRWANHRRSSSLEASIESWYL